MGKAALDAGWSKPEGLKPVLNSEAQLIVRRVQVHYKGLRVLLAWRDAQGGCLPPSFPNLVLPPQVNMSHQFQAGQSSY